ncbi:hypothetical protein NQ314_008138 [Rhamnusium bicolor]|uniref:Uncharacterized protein n=1 Tax=Rhamnusium bicolor TaxID=1586634 RepID=A0AAV8YGM3_9CUCU|nr:hypothetical protein NQ314_008138 [Rhamnusium bicolor]
MHTFKKLFYSSLLIISVFSSDLLNTIDAARPASKNETIAQNNASRQIATEGGNLPPTIEHDTHLGREHVREKYNVSLLLLNKSSTDIQPLTVDNPPNKTVHLEVDNPPNETHSSVDISVNKTLPKIKPVIENPQEIDLGIPKKNDNKKIVGKKGVPDYDATFTNINNTSTKMNFTIISSTVNPNIILITRPKKPKITVHGEAADALSETKYNKSEVHTPKIPSFDTILEEKSNRADYVVPIVAVILSVPLVAIIISVLYKRGTDWWQHRNYRRMDFLIEGMYNN